MLNLTRLSGGHNRACPFGVLKAPSHDNKSHFSNLQLFLALLYFSKCADPVQLKDAKDVATDIGASGGRKSGFSVEIWESAPKPGARGHRPTFFILSWTKVLFIPSCLPLRRLPPSRGNRLALARSTRTSLRPQNIPLLSRLDVRHGTHFKLLFEPSLPLHRSKLRRTMWTAISKMW